nr:hypothetical protein GCM10017745_04440 [Saccharothrix mutabilis subsp. capreolus]
MSSTSKPSPRAASASAAEAVAPHTTRPAAAAARSTEPPINPSPTTHTSRTRHILPAHPDISRELRNR